MHVSLACLCSHVHVALPFSTLIIFCFKVQLSPDPDYKELSTQGQCVQLHVQ